MLGLDLLDVALGLAFLYLLMSVVCSAAVEFFEALMKFRARDLEHGIRELLNDPTLVKAVYDHPLVASLYSGTYGAAGGARYTIGEMLSWRKRRLPSYIPARNFVLALLDRIWGPLAVDGTLAPLPVPPQSAMPTARPTIRLPAVLLHATATTAHEAVSRLVAAAGADAVKARENVEEWFNSSMDRVSGWFKRRTQYILLATGLAAAALFNVDSIGIAKVLATNKALRQEVVQSALDYAAQHGERKPEVKTDKGQADKGATKAEATKANPAAGQPATGASPAPTTDAAPATPADPRKEADDKLKALNARIAELNQSGLPLGWDNPYVPTPASGYDWIVRVLGIMITGCAVSLGAPVWFDVLNKIIVVRSTVKPKEKSGTEGAKEPQA